MRTVLPIAVLVLAFASGWAAEWQVYLHSNDVKSVWVADDVLLWGSTGGAVVETLSTHGQVKFNTVNTSLKSNWISSVAIDGRGRMWIGTDGYGIAMRSDEGWKLFSTKTYSLPSDEVTSIAVWGDTVVVGTSTGVARFINGKLSDYYVGDDWGLADDDKVNCVAINADVLLVGTDNGLFCMNLGDLKWSTIHSEKVVSIDYDGSGKFWFVTGVVENDRKIYTFDGSEKRMASKRRLEGYTIRNISANQNQIWVATSGGPARYDRLTDAWYYARLNLDPLNLRDSYPILVAEDGMVWLATRTGVAELRAQGDSTWVFHNSDGPAGNYVEDIAVDADNNIWLATGERGFKPYARGMNIGVLLFDRKQGRWRQFRRGDGSLTSDIVYCVESNHMDRSVWFGCWDIVVGGLFRYDLNNSSWSSYATSLQSLVIADIYVDKKGRVVFSEYGTTKYSGGIVLLCPQRICNNDVLVRYTYGEPCMNAKYVTAIGPCPSGSFMTGNFAVEHEDEVHLINVGESLVNKNDDKCRRWSTAGNYFGGYCHHISLDSTNIVWLGTDGGLSAFDFSDSTWHGVSSTLGKVFDIEVDKYNRKWVATDLGLWVIRKVGLGWNPTDFKIELYDNSNSPLPDLPLMAVEFDADGCLWIGTENGGTYMLKPDPPDTLVVQPTVWVDAYPNPFDFRKHSSLGFVGCKPGTQINIYTLTGEKIAEVKCGEALSRSAMEKIGIVSGIYVYSAYAEDGEKFIGKFVVLR